MTKVEIDAKAAQSSVRTGVTLCSNDSSFIVLKFWEINMKINPQQGSTEFVIEAILFSIRHKTRDLQQLVLFPFASLVTEYKVVQF